ncbi:MAG: mechanosensitive ion channel family protein [Victivallales bacterium]|nr:mechanosensitive ion channel family protein [Victivallales bacterium]
MNPDSTQKALTPVVSFWEPLTAHVQRFADWAFAQRVNLLFFLCVVLCSIIVSWLLCRLIKAVILKFAGEERREAVQDALAATSRTICILLASTGIACGLFMLHLPPRLLNVLYKIYYLVSLICVTCILQKSIGGVAQYFRKVAQKKEMPLDDLLVTLIQHTCQVALWIVVVLFGCQNIFGINISAILAGAGVLGLAIAFAAQNTIANFFGAISIILDHPFKIGDVVSLGTDGTRLGVVDGIGLRSTRIRALDGTVWTVPNKEISEVTIKNISCRPNFKAEMNIGLTYDTSNERIGEAIAILQDIFRKAPLIDMEKAPPRIFFSDFKDWSLNITVVMWIQTQNWVEYMETRNHINRQVLERFNAAGLEFAFPTNTTYLIQESEKN